MNRVNVIFIIVVILIVSAIFYYNGYENTGKMIIDEKIYQKRNFHIGSGRCKGFTQHTLFEKDNYKYILEVQCHEGDYFVRTDGSYVELTLFIEENSITEDELLKSNIGRKCYECTE